MQYVLLGLAVLVLALYVLYDVRRRRATAGPRHCGVCGSLLKRKRFRWRMEDKEVIACANCTRNLEAQQSRAAVKAFLDKQ